MNAQPTTTERQFIPLTKYDMDGSESTIWIEKSEGLLNMIRNIANVAVATQNSMKK